MKNKYLVFGVSAFSAFLLGYLLFSTCNPISNKCYANENNALEQEGVLVQDLVPQSFKEAVDSGEYKLIDIRTSEEYNSGHIKNADNIDFYQTQAFLNYVDSLDKNQKYLIYCRSGNRTSQAIGMMKARGIENVSHLKGGINKWIASGYAVE